MEKMLNIVLFGPPGAGKGTQSENLINKYGLVHLSTGDILRSEIARGTALGKKAKDIMDKGELVGDEIVIGMIESKLDENPHAKGFIFDGFPRTALQAVALDDLLQKKGTGISGMLALEVENEELVKRLLLRGQESGRPDDRNEEVIRRRIEEYNNKTLPLKNYYNEQGKFHSIHGIGSIDDIFKLLVDRIVFLNAEMDLTALETDLEHLDLTIQDFEVADEIAPELLLEIDAIKRSEAEEEEEERELKKQARKSNKPVASRASATSAAKTSAKKSPVKKAVAKKVASRASATRVSRASDGKASKKAAPKKAAKKIAAKKVASRVSTTKVSKTLGTKASAKKSPAKKTASRTSAAKASKKVPAKKVASRASAAKKAAPKKAMPKTKSKANTKKVTKPAKKGSSRK